MKLQLPPDLSFEMSISVLLGKECLESWPVAILLHGLTLLAIHHHRGETDTSTGALWWCAAVLLVCWCSDPNPQPHNLVTTSSCITKLALQLNTCSFVDY